MKMVTLHFTLGPVQGFVGQARRTRDLWAGSYLLSYLAGCAMKAVVDRGGNIVFPSVNNDRLFLAITDRMKRPSRIDDPAASVGSLPNRFKAEVPEGFGPKDCVKAVQDKWRDVVRAVKEKLDELVKSCGGVHQKMWDRQVNHIWDMAWAIGGDDALLDIRKNLRTHLPLPEEGEKCTVCGERQEVSGKGTGTDVSRKEMGAWLR